MPVRPPRMRPEPALAEFRSHPSGSSGRGASACAGRMQFLAQISLADVEADGTGLLSIFMCQNDPGLCEEWDAAGGNRAFVFGADAVHLPAPLSDGDVLIDEASAVGFDEVGAAGYLDAVDRWHQQTGRPVREVLGHVRGEAAWLQADETPLCGACGQPMTFTVQLEEGHDHRTAANFGGGGCGFGFRCDHCRVAAFRWQR